MAVGTVPIYSRVDSFIGIFFALKYIEAFLAQNKLNNSVRAVVEAWYRTD